MGPTRSLITEVEASPRSNLSSCHEPCLELCPSFLKSFSSAFSSGSLDVQFANEFLSLQLELEVGLLGGKELHRVVELSHLCAQCIELGGLSGLALLFTLLFRRRLRQRSSSRRLGARVVRSAFV